MKIKDIMTANPETLTTNASVFEAAQKMKNLDVGIIPVVQDNSVQGVLTDRDIVTRGLAENRDPAHTRVNEIMSGNPYTCKESSDVKDCAHLMENKKVRRLVVTDDGGRPVGIVSLGDIATRAGQELGGEVISMVSEPSKPHR